MTAQVENAEQAQAVMVVLRAVSKTFPGGVEAVRNVDLQVAGGEFVALIGPSGCGKSTLLRIIAGLERATSSGAVVDAGPPQRVAFVFQDAHLLPWRSVRDNVALPLELQRVERDER